MEHFWGIEAITRRLGLRNPKSFYRAYKQGRVFAFKRAFPRSPFRRVWYSNSELMARCELIQCKFSLEEFRAKQNKASQ